MTHRSRDPRSDCDGETVVTAQVQTHGRLADVWECRACGETNSPGVRRRLRQVYQRLIDSGRLDPPPIAPEVEFGPLTYAGVCRDRAESIAEELRGMARHRGNAEAYDALEAELAFCRRVVERAEAIGRAFADRRAELLDRYAQLK